MLTIQEQLWEAEAYIKRQNNMIDELIKSLQEVKFICERGKAWGLDKDDIDKMLKTINKNI